MTDEAAAKRYSVAADIPCGFRSAQKNPPEGWGRISKIAPDSLELETHFPLLPTERVYLSFAVEGTYRFEDVPAQVESVLPGAPLCSAKLAIDEGEARARLREAVLFLVNRA